jgi:pimeloyl-ACP methyl ester carboxylesterase
MLIAQGVIPMTKYKYASIDGLKTFYREAGLLDAPTIVLLHGFPSSSHMFRDLIPKLAGEARVIAPDFPAFGYSDQPDRSRFTYTFDNLASVIEKLLFDHLKLQKFSIYVQDYGAPIGFRLASRHPEAIQGVVVQNGNAYLEGLGSAFDPIRSFWNKRTPESEAVMRGFLNLETTRFQYVTGTRDPASISPDSYTLDQVRLDAPGNQDIQLDLFFDYQNNVKLYPEWQTYFRKHQPKMLVVWGKNDPFFTEEGAKAYTRDTPNAELHLLNTGHFALEEDGDEIAEHMARFLRTFREKQRGAA